MTLEVLRDSFADFVKTVCGRLICDLADLAEIRLRVLDHENQELLACGPVAASKTSPKTAAPAGGSGDAGELAHEPDPRAEAIRVPIEVAGETLGCLTCNRSGERLEATVRSLAAHLGERFAVEQDLDHMTGQLSQSYDEINLLYRFSHGLRPDESFTKAARKLLEETADLLEQRLLIFCQPDHDHIEWSAGSSSTFPDVVHWLTGNWDALEAIQTEFTTKLRGRESRGSSRHASIVYGPDGPIHYVICPVRVRSEVTGYVGVFRIENEPFIETGELRLLEVLAEELSNVATTRQLYQELREMLFNTVRSLVAAIEAKDVYTRGHSERVYRYSVKIGERMELPSDDMQTLSWASVLHDVGKIGISGDILNKPSKLTDEEFAEIKTHPAKGCLVLAPIPQLAATIPGIRHHHERFDGRGYPDGLQGEGIPLIARIIAVADTFDAIYSSRAYRAARTVEWAIEEIRRCSGTQFDPRIVEVFLKLAEEGALDEVKHEAQDAMPNLDAEAEAA